jgi:hypothetical protein
MELLTLSTVLSTTVNGKSVEKPRLFHRQQKNSTTFHRAVEFLKVYRILFP